MYLLLSSKQLNSASPINSEVRRALCRIICTGNPLEAMLQGWSHGCCLCLHFQNKRSQKDGTWIKSSKYLVSRLLLEACQDRKEINVMTFRQEQFNLVKAVQRQMRTHSDHPLSFGPPRSAQINFMLTGLETMRWATITVKPCPYGKNIPERFIDKRI